MHSIAPDAGPPALPPSFALIPYAERFLEGRRVVIFGDAASGLAAEAADRGTRVVHVYDPDGARVARAVATAEGQGVSYAVFKEGAEVAVRDGSFDTCLIPDISLFADPRGLLARARKLLVAGGVVIVATPPVEGQRGESLGKGKGPLNYYDFYDVVFKSFPAIKMVGQVPFGGYALVDFGLDGDPEVSVDTSLAEGAARDPVAYVAIASDRRVSVDPYAIIQLPPGPDGPSEAEQQAERLALSESRAKGEAMRVELEALREGRRAAEAKLSDEQRRNAELVRALNEAGVLPRQLEQKLIEETRRAELLMAQQNRNQDASERLSREVRSHQERAQQAAKSLAEAQADRARLAQREQDLLRKLREQEATPRGVDPAKVDALRKRLEDTERAAEEQRRLAGEAEQQRAALQTQLAALQTQLAALQTEVEALRGQNRSLRAQADGARGQVAQVEALRGQNAALQAQIDALRGQASALQAQAAEVREEAQQEQAAQVADLTAAEATLRERAREIAALRAEIERRGGMVRELLQTMEAQGQGAFGPAVALERERSAHLASELSAARTRADGLAQQLARRDVEVAAAQSRLADAQRELAAARAEILASRAFQAAPPSSEPTPVEQPPAPPPDASAEASVEADASGG